MLKEFTFAPLPVLARDSLAVVKCVTCEKYVRIFVMLRRTSAHPIRLHAGAVIWGDFSCFVWRASETGGPLRSGY